MYFDMIIAETPSIPFRPEDSVVEGSDCKGLDGLHAS